MKQRLLAAAALSLFLSAPVFAEEAKPDDMVAFDLAAEDWVSTKTARVTLNVEAAVSAATAGSTRDDMTKAVNGAAKGDWRLVNFNRMQDQTGLERWSAGFEARLSEAALGGLSDAAKKASKAGMQITVGDVDFSPTLDETEAVKSTLRTRLYKQAADQLTSLNGALPGRTYRIAQITFDGASPIMRQPRMLRAKAMTMAASAPMEDAAELQKSEKIRLNARVILATAPTPAAAQNH